MPGCRGHGNDTRHAPFGTRVTSRGGRLRPCSGHGHHTTTPPHPVRSPLTAVAFDGVGRRFGDTLALDAVDLRIAAGETVALLGPNGAGKTTAIGIMLGLARPVGGPGQHARHAAAPGRPFRPGRRDAPVGRAPARRPRRRARRARARPLPVPVAARRRSSNAPDSPPLVDRRAETLSGGEAQRVRFAFAIAGDPDLVFLDEPTVAMDVESRRAFWDDMRRFAAEGRTVLFATHYLDEADHIADRIIVLDHGRVVGDGTPAELKATVTRPHRPVRARPRGRGRRGGPRRPARRRTRRPPRRRAVPADPRRGRDRPRPRRRRTSPSATWRWPAPTSTPPSSP